MLFVGTVQVLQICRGKAEPFLYGEGTDGGGQPFDSYNGGQGVYGGSESKH